MLICCVGDGVNIGGRHSKHEKNLSIGSMSKQCSKYKGQLHIWEQCCKVKYAHVL